MPIAPPVDLVRQRYNRLAPIYPAFEWFFALPHGIRRAAIERLRLSVGDTVLEVGCGTGRNFGYLEKAVGPAGRIHAIDVSEGMLAQAHARSSRHAWSNIMFVHGDALVCPMPATIHHALFCLSYGTMGKRREILARMWDRLQPGGRVVVVDAKTPPGALGRLVGASFRSISSATVLGDPDHAPWADLEALGAVVEMEEWSFGAYFITVGRKR